MEGIVVSYLIIVSIGATRMNLDCSILSVDRSCNTKNPRFETDLSERGVDDGGTEHGVPGGARLRRHNLAKGNLHLDCSSEGHQS